MKEENMKEQIISKEFIYNKINTKIGLFEKCIEEVKKIRK